MQNQPSSPPKPVTDWWRPDLVALPRLTFARRLARWVIRGIVKLLVLINMRATVTGLEWQGAWAKIEIDIFLND